jgi:DNA-binding protein HU-beta
MNKTELVERISVEAEINKAQASRAVESMIRNISNALKHGDHVTLSGFGSFTVYERKARNGRNPQTGSVIKIKSQRVAKFSSGVDLKRAVGRR